MSGNAPMPMLRAPAPAPAFELLGGAGMAELGAVIDAMQQRIAAACQMPADILFGRDVAPRAADATSRAAERDVLREFRDRVAPRRRSATS